MNVKLTIPKDAITRSLEDKLRCIDMPGLPDEWYGRAVGALRGGDGGEHGQLLYGIVRQSARHQSQMTVLDVGTARGFTALVMSLAIEGSGVDGTVYSVDTVGHDELVEWHSAKHDPADPLAGRLFSRREIWNRWFPDAMRQVVVVHGKSAAILESWNRGPIDVAFLDGSHAYEDVSRELALLDELVSQDYGIVVLDDYHMGEFVGRIRSKAVNLLAWMIGRSIGWMSDRFSDLAPRFGQSTEYRLVKQRFGGVRRALDEFVEQKQGDWALELVSMPRRGSYQGQDYCVAVLSRRRGLE